jgi:hypothetical protein
LIPFCGRPDCFVPETPKGDEPVAVWSNYPHTGRVFRYVRVGTMDDPGTCPPDIHIHMSSKLPWVALPPNARTVPEF